MKRTLTGRGLPACGPLRRCWKGDVLLPLVEPALFAKYKLLPPNGTLFFGPPGCGKTHIARALAQKAEREFIEVKPSDLGSIYVHGSQGKIRQLFDKAVEKSPCLVFRWRGVLRTGGGLSSLPRGISVGSSDGSRQALPI